jgi:hypothetical protein
MTFHERVLALDYLRLSPRQTRFLVTVALHGGYCVRRQYLAFAGAAYGKNVRDFLDGLVAQRVAERFLFQGNRGHIYHLHARSIYRALDQSDNRNRRHVSPAVIARKLMVLDFVLTEPEAEWYATEQEKVALFTERFRVPQSDLPSRVYDASDTLLPPTTRYFIHKLPIFLANPQRPDVGTGDGAGTVGDGASDRSIAALGTGTADGPIAGSVATPHFVYLVNEPTGHGLEQFLADHARLLAALPAWAVIAVCPAGQPGLHACRAAFERYRGGTTTARVPSDATELRWYFHTRRQVEQGQLRDLSVDDIRRYQTIHARRNGAGTEGLYASWLRGGDAAIEAAIETASHPGRTSRPARVGTLLLRELPFHYSQFGALPGVV